MNNERVARTHAAVMGVETRHLGGRRNGMWQIKTIDAWNDAPPFDANLVFGVWLPRLQANGWCAALLMVQSEWSATISKKHAESHYATAPQAHEATGLAIELAMGVEAPA